MTDTLKTLLGDNQALINEVSGYETSATNNAEKVQVLERDIKQAVDKRQELKELIRNATGLSEVSEEALSKLSNGDEALKSELSTLQDRLQSVTDERDGMGSKHSLELNKRDMTDILRNMGIDSQVWNNDALNAVRDMMLNGASYESGSFVYRNEDGSTIYGSGSNPLTVAEKLTEIRESENVYQFKPATGAGGGDSKGGNIPSKSTTDNQRAAEMAKKVS